MLLDNKVLYSVKRAKYEIVKTRLIRIPAHIPTSVIEAAIAKQSSIKENTEEGATKADIEKVLKASMSVTQTIDISVSDVKLEESSIENLNFTAKILVNRKRDGLSVEKTEHDLAVDIQEEWAPHKSGRVYGGKGDRFSVKIDGREWNAKNERLDLNDIQSVIVNAFIDRL